MSPLNAGAQPDGTSSPSGRAALPSTPPHVYAWVLFLVALVGYIVLTALHDAVPPVFDLLLGLNGGAATSLSWPLNNG